MQAKGNKWELLQLSKYKMQFITQVGVQCLDLNIQSMYAPQTYCPSQSPHAH